MKIFRKIITGLFAAVILLAAVFLAGRYGWKMPGFQPRQEAGTEAPTAGEPGAVTENERFGVYVRIARSDVGSVYLKVSRFSKEYPDADGSLPEAGAWLSQQDDLTDCLQKLSLVEEAYQLLLGDNAWELLDTAGCADTDVFWNGEPVEPVEAIMKAAGLRGASSESGEAAGS